MLNSNDCSIVVIRNHSLRNARSSLNPIIIIAVSPAKVYVETPDCKFKFKFDN